MNAFSCETPTHVISEAETVAAALIAAYTHVSEGTDRLQIYKDGEQIGTAQRRVTIGTSGKKWRSHDTIEISIKKGLLDEED